MRNRVWLVIGIGGTLATSTGARAAEPFATVRHVPPVEAETGKPLRLVADIDDAWKEPRLVARYRTAGSDGRTPFGEAPFERSSAGGYYATIPASEVKRPGVEYFIVGRAEAGHDVTHFGSADAPHEVRVEPEANLRWIEAEHARIAGRYARVRARMEGIRFGESDGVDRYLRGEVDWTSRVVGALYSFTLGYGFVEGITPVARDPDDDDPSVEHDARYGFAEVRMRMHRSIWVDAGVSLGVSHEGFSAGVRGLVVLGQDWRSCVVIGAEYLQDLDRSIWLRLQWDSVPPFLMGATVRETRFPGSNIGRGTVLSWDLTYPATTWLSITAAVSYASRSERPGQFGGSVGTTFEF